MITTAQARDSMLDLEPNTTEKVMEDFYARLVRCARDGYRVVLHGPSGSGKGFAARYYSTEYARVTKNKDGKPTDRDRQPFCLMSCSNLVTREQANNDLFGVVPGVFTDAYRKGKAGYFEVCRNGGILFLDEVADLPLETQSLLLTALDRPGSANRVGAGPDDEYHYVTTDVKVIFATNKPLESIRFDLLERIDVCLEIPGLDQRKSEIGPAIELHASRALEGHQEFRGDLKETSVLIRERLESFAQDRTWPGNFRTLRNVTAEAVCFSDATKPRPDFIDEVERYFKSMVDVAKIVPSGVGSLTPEPREAGRVAPGTAGSISLDEREIVSLEHWVKGISRRGALANSREIAEFLIGTEGRWFTRAELDKVIGKSEQTTRNRIAGLISVELIKQEGEKYRFLGLPVASPDLAIKWPSWEDIEAFEWEPQHVVSGSEWTRARDDIVRLLDTTRGVYIGGEKRTGKTTLAWDVATSQHRTVWWWDLTRTGSLEGCLKRLEEFVVRCGWDEAGELGTEGLTLCDRAARLGPFVNCMRSRAHRNGALLIVIDGEGALVSEDDRDALKVIVSEWTSCSLVVVGPKLEDNLGASDSRKELKEYRIGSGSGHTEK
jgi:hypothetical protein